MQPLSDLASFWRMMFHWPTFWHELVMCCEKVSKGCRVTPSTHVVQLLGSWRLSTVILNLLPTSFVYLVKEVVIDFPAERHKLRSCIQWCGSSR